MEGQMQDVLAERARWAVVCADARSALAGMADASVDAVVTDPPYALTDKRGGAKGFMGSTWDTGHVAHDPNFWAEVLRVVKPGAFLLAFGGTRTYHRLACAIEDAEWELRDMIVHWLYGSGFPKSKSCLKPSHEPILLAKAPGPLQPLQIDACRVPTGEARPALVHTGRTGKVYGAGLEGSRQIEPTMQGRWPPNTLFSHVGGPDGCQPAGVRRVRGEHGSTRGASTHVYGNGKGFTVATGEPVGYADADGYEQVDAWTCVPQCPIRLLDEQAGPRTSGGYPPEGGQRSHVATYGTPNERGVQRFTSSTGSASRFFPTFAPDPEDAVPLRYEAKAPARERRLADGTPTGHPTQKPVALAQWLATLVCRPGGTVLDPFAGVASLGIGALRAGCHYIGIEQDAGYAAVAQRRLGEEQEQHSGPLFAGIAAQR